ncbi:MAG: cyclic nucleotide-binding domain-containing protein [Pseudomonadales bacterium]|nr:cyclic nucleotide-binding domain-containing protein [Pseudomonadales bacterium]
MKVIPPENYTKQSIENLLMGIPFINQIAKIGEDELDTLMEHSKLIELKTGEVVCRAGEVDSRYFFLLKGQLSVFPAHELDKEHEVNRLTPGQSFGALSIICKTPRTATLAVSANSPSALLISIDLVGLGTLEDLSVFSLETKLALYRTVVNNTRWQLEVYKMDYPDHPLTAKSKAVEVYIGKKNTLEELESLNKQIKKLTFIISEWNNILNPVGKQHQDRGSMV